MLQFVLLLTSNWPLLMVNSSLSAATLALSGAGSIDKQFWAEESAILPITFNTQLVLAMKLNFCIFVVSALNSSNLQSNFDSVTG